MKCRICLEEKEQSKFYFRKDSQKYRTECKSCMKQRIQEYESKHRESSNARKILWDKENRIKSNTLKTEWKKNNRDKVKKYNKLYGAKYTMKRYNSDALFKLRHLLRSRLNNFLKTKTFSRDKSIKNIIGCSMNELKVYIEMQFKSGMNWNNHGEWHIDHVKPLSASTTKEETYALMHYSNLQPLWAIDNMKKGNRR